MAHSRLIARRSLCTAAARFRPVALATSIVLVAPLVPLDKIGPVPALTMDAASAAQPSLSVWSHVFSKAQAARGERAYRTSCGYCHKDDLSGGFMDDGVGRAPALAGPRAFGSSFVERWHDHNLGDLVFVIASTMPKQAPTSLSLDTYVDITAFLLEKNGVPAGDDDLPADVPTLRDIVVTAPPR